jgi:hypothetical protein
MVFKSKYELILAVLDWLHDETLAGKDPSDYDIAVEFSLSLQEAREIHEELLKSGKLH